MAAETNLIKTVDLARVREAEFVSMFSGDVRKLRELLGISRLIPKQAGAALKAYKATGVLESGNVAEGDTIPLSKYETSPIFVGEISLRKWRKATSAEAIIERGYDQAVTMTTDKMLVDIQKELRRSFVEFLATGTGEASGGTFQAALAAAWGQLQVLFEDSGISSVYLINPLDAADYLGSAAITVQTAFGMSYVENFLGLGTVVMDSHVPKGTVYATAKENLIGYYVPANGSDLEEAFSFTTDESGLIGIHEEPDYTNMTASDTVISGLTVLAERLDGIVVATIGA